MGDSGRRGRVLAAACFVALALAGCGGTSELLNTASLTAPSVTVAGHSSTHGESTHEIYSRVARGAKTCWFGPGKPLDQRYAFDGELASDADGGAAEVAVHIRTPDQPNPRGGKVFIVAITKLADGASLVTEARRIPDTMASQLRTDVSRWARTGSIECSALTVPGMELAASSVPLPVRKPALVKKAKGKPKAQKK